MTIIKQKDGLDGNAFYLSFSCSSLILSSHSFRVDSVDATSMMEDRLSEVFAKVMG